MLLHAGQVVAYCKALLEVFRDHGDRTDRQKARLMWLVERWGVDKFRDAIAERMGEPLAKVPTHRHPTSAHPAPPHPLTPRLRCMHPCTFVPA